MQVASAQRCCELTTSAFTPRNRGLQLARRQQYGRRGAVACRASMGINITEGYKQDGEGRGAAPRSPYGLSVRQMNALGIVGENAQELWTPDEASLSAKSFYVGDDINENKRVATRMRGGSYGPGSAPPDLPSLLLDSRIVYIGMALVPAVTELVMSELLWCNYDRPEKPIYLYLHSTGSQTADGQTVGFEQEAYAILDTMAYVRSDIHTVVVGQAFGNAALLLAAGKKGCRWATPNSRIMTCPPRMNRTFGYAKNIMIKANEIENDLETYVDFMEKFTGKDKDVLRKDAGRNRYFTPEAAIEYGLIDMVVETEGTSGSLIEGRDYERMLANTQAAQRRAAGAGAGGPGAEAGM